MIIIALFKIVFLKKLYKVNIKIINNILKINLYKNMKNISIKNKIYI